MPSENGYVVVVPELYSAEAAEYLASAESHRQLLNCIRRIKHGLSVDDDRVFIGGHGIGGEVAADFVSGHPDLFAGVISIAGLGRRSLHFTNHNCPFVPWYMVVGERQPAWYDRLRIFVERMFRRDSRTHEINDFILVRYPNRGFESFFEESPRLFEWMARQRRATMPNKLVDVTLMRSTDTSWYWANLDGLSNPSGNMDEPTDWNATPERTTRLSVQITSRNSIRVSSQPCDLVIHVSPDLPGIDVQKSITYISGRTRRKVDYAPSLKAMLDEYRGHRRTQASVLHETAYSKVAGNRMFTAEVEDVSSGRGVRYRVNREDGPLTYREVVNLWQHNQAFRDWYTTLLANSPFSAYRWETPGLRQATIDSHFEFVLLDSPRFASRITDASTYSGYFVDDDLNHGIVVFPNLSGDATLIVPSPRTDTDAYGHLAAFLRCAPHTQIDTFWRMIGETVASAVARKPVWLSTAGGGVAWLHVRIDSHPKYYGYVPYRSSR